VLQVRFASPVHLGVSAQSSDGGLVIPIDDVSWHALCFHRAIELTTNVADAPGYALKIERAVKASHFPREVAPLLLANATQIHQEEACDGLSRIDACCPVHQGLCAAKPPICGDALDPLTTCVWVVDLRDIGHPVPYPYPDRTAAEVARRCFIRDAITEEVDSLTQSA
jgi:hypothetical protein